MTLDALILLSGTLIALLPFLGFPLKWDNVILMLLGVFVIGLGIIVRRRGLVRPTAVSKGKEFVEKIARAETEAHEA